MAMRFIRRQNAVGQGGFHSALLEHCDGECARPVGRRDPEHRHETFSYVYDCGEYGNHPEALRREVDRVDTDHDVDILFISHAHTDHISGVESLVTNLRRAGKRVVTVIMPLLDSGEKLLTLAGIAHSGQIVSTFTENLVIDPSRAFGEGTEVIFVSGESRESEGQSLNPDDNLTWYFEGPPPAMRADGASAVSHSQDIRVALGGNGPDWRLRTFVDPRSVGTVDAFLVQLNEVLRDNRIAIDVIGGPLSVDDMISLAAKYGDHLRTAYLRVAKVQNLNVTSMSLFSGPRTHPYTLWERRGFRHLDQGAGNWRRLHDPRVTEIGWLGTGDAMLANKQRWTSFQKHFEDVAAQVITAVLPHHGSEDNHQLDFLDWFPHLREVVVAADPPPHWRHPASRVVIDAASKGIPLKLVTSAPGTELIETFVWVRELR